MACRYKISGCITDPWDTIRACRLGIVVNNQNLGIINLGLDGMLYWVSCCYLMVCCITLFL